jgi:glutaminyl-peptide cyclotransferase
MFKRLITLTVLLFVGITAYGALSQEGEATEEPVEVEILVPEVLSEIPHSTDDFTQGLVWTDGRLFQSTGLYGESLLQELDPETGEALREVELTDDYFGEGLALVGEQLVQITWREQTAFVYDMETFEQTDTFTYETEGWGLCYDGESIYMTDGSPILYQRDPETFEVTDEIMVTLQGQPVPQLNELECVEEDVYANVWQTDAIVRIDKATGEVTGLIDARGLLTRQQRARLEGGAVLNGIAYNAEDETFLITGKLWPLMFEVRFIPVEPEG